MKNKTSLELRSNLQLDVTLASLMSCSEASSSSKASPPCHYSETHRAVEFLFQYQKCECQETDQGHAATSSLHLIYMKRDSSLQVNLLTIGIGTMSESPHQDACLTLHAVSCIHLNIQRQMSCIYFKSCKGYHRWQPYNRQGLI